EQTDPGFVIADQGSLLVRDGQDRSALLLPGEAAFSPTASQRIGAADAADASFFEIDLVGANDQDVSGGAVVYVSPPFVGVAGERSLKLVRDVLAPDETTTVIGQNGPVLVLATSGSLRVEATDGSSADLGVGKAGAFTGDVIVRGAGPDFSTFVAAAMTEGLKEAEAYGTPRATPESAATSGNGAISVVTHSCPAELKTSEASPDVCPLDPKAMILDLVALDGEQPKDLGSPPVRDGLPIWSDLAPGRYGLRAVVLADGFDRFFIANREGIGGPPENGYKAAGEEGYLIELTDEKPSTRVDVYAMPRGDRKDREKTPVAGGGVQDVGAAASPVVEQSMAPGSTPVTTKAVARPRRGSITIRVLSCPDPFETYNPA
ncbi:MAG: hypothetical protein ACR2J8_00485, partial [Thermomicrobiales bacterium]